MLMNVDKTHEQEMLANYRKLKKLRYTEMDLSDYFDFFEHACVPHAVDALSGKAFKCYQGKLGALNKNYDKISAMAREHNSGRRMHYNIKQMLENYHKFILSAYSGYPSPDMTPVDYLIEAEHSCIIARTIYNQSNPELGTEE